MSNIAHLDTTALDNAAKFFRVMQKAGANFTEPMQDIEKRTNLVAYLQLGCPSISTLVEIANPPTPENVILARQILGDDFILPGEMGEVFGYVYSEKQLIRFAKDVPGVRTLQWLHDNDFMLIPGPPAYVRLDVIRDLDSSLFHHGFEHELGREGFGYHCEWIMLRKGAVPNSCSKDQEEQLKFIRRSQYVPGVIEVAYGMIVYWKVRGKYLMHGLTLRTSSFRNSHSVCISDKNNKLDICTDIDDRAYSNVGMSSVRKNRSRDFTNI